MEKINEGFTEKVDEIVDRCNIKHMFEYEKEETTFSKQEVMDLLKRTWWWGYQSGYKKSYDKVYNFDGKKVK